MRGFIAAVVIALLALPGCGEPEDGSPETEPEVQAPAREHVSNVPPMGPTNIVRLAQDSEQHTTLVAAIEAADYVTAVAASGPLTVFAPTNAAFDALPEGTVESLLEPDQADQLREILKYHVTTSALGRSSFHDGQSLGMANGAKAMLRVEGEDVWINDAKVVGSVRAENGMLHVIDAVLLPPEGS